MNGYPLKIAGIVPGRIAEVSVVGEESSDNDLALSALGGNAGSFRQLVERHQRHAILYARGMVGNTDDAYDLSQEAFIRAFRNLKRFNPVYPFRVWFFRILSNLCKNHLRQRRSRAKVVTSSELTGRAAAPKTERPDIVFERTEIERQVWEGIRELPEKFKEIIMLSHFQEMSYEQIAVTLDIPRGSVMSRLYYARLKLREILNKNGVTL